MKRYITPLIKGINMESENMMAASGPGISGGDATEDAGAKKYFGSFDWDEEELQGEEPDVSIDRYGYAHYGSQR